jgi:hypothetical protein
VVRHWKNPDIALFEIVSGTIPDVALAEANIPSFTNAIAELACDTLHKDLVEIADNHLREATWSQSEGYRQDIRGGDQTTRVMYGKQHLRACHSHLPHSVVQRA